MCSGEGLREPPCLGMGPADAAFEVTAGPRSFIFTEKRRKLLGWQWLARCFVSAVNGRELITACTRPVRQLSRIPGGLKNTALPALFFFWLLKHEAPFNLFSLKKAIQTSYINYALSIRIKGERPSSCCQWTFWWTDTWRLTLWLAYAYCNSKCDFKIKA